MAILVRNKERRTGRGGQLLGLRGQRGPQPGLEASEALLPEFVAGLVQERPRGVGKLRKQLRPRKPRQQVGHAPCDWQPRVLPWAVRDGWRRCRGVGSAPPSVPALLRAAARGRAWLAPGPASVVAGGRRAQGRELPVRTRGPGAARRAAGLGTRRRGRRRPAISRFGRKLGPFPPAVAHRPLLIALTAAIE